MRLRPGKIIRYAPVRQSEDESGPPPPAAASSAAARAPATPALLAHVLLVLLAVIVLGRLLAWGLSYLHQPLVIGEMLAGILVGPSLIGERASAFILPPAAGPPLDVLGQIGAVLYMFIVGLDLNASLLRRRVHTTVVISHASILVPFLLGALLALDLHPQLAGRDIPFAAFALFIGVALSITAFPVLARILTDRGMEKTPLGVMALSCAAIDDVTAWCLLALVVGVARAQIGAGLSVVAGALLFIALMFGVARPVLRRLVARLPEPLPRASMVAVFTALLASALAAESIGIHAVFGAFLLGAVIPHDSTVARAFIRHLEPVVTVLLLPAFFALTGMRTRIDLLSGTGAWFTCGLILLVATLGKFGGTLGAARLTGMGWRDAAALGTLMNARGLMGLVVLNIGLDLGIISPGLFTMMVVMAVVTTMVASPMLSLFVPSDPGATRL